MQFPELSIENLRGFGYTADEARFLYLVATHSGYFSTRQYLAFTDAKSGEKSMTFTQKVLGKGHANARLLLRNAVGPSPPPKYFRLHRELSPHP